MCLLTLKHKDFDHPAYEIQISKAIKDISSFLSQAKPSLHLTKYIMYIRSLQKLLLSIPTDPTFNTIRIEMLHYFYHAKQLLDVMRTFQANESMIRRILSLSHEIMELRISLDSIITRTALVPDLNMQTRTDLYDALINICANIVPKSENNLIGALMNITSLAGKVRSNEFSEQLNLVSGKVQKFLKLLKSLMSEGHSDVMGYVRIKR